MDEQCRDWFVAEVNGKSFLVFNATELSDEPVCDADLFYVEAHGPEMQAARSAARSLRSCPPPPPEFTGNGCNGAVRPKAWLGGGDGDPAGFNRLIQQVAQPQRFLQRQPGQCMLALQMATGVIVAALEVNDDMFAAGGDLKFTKCSHYRTGFRRAILLETGHGINGLLSG